MNPLSQWVVWVRGAGEMGSAVAWTLKRCGFPVFCSELEQPLAIRRVVTFSDAMLHGAAEVEGLPARRVTPAEIASSLREQFLPVVLDNEEILRVQAQIYVDARMRKRVEPDQRPYFDFCVGLGPGFTAGGNVHAVIETQRGHNLGRVITTGSAAPDTGIPGEVGGHTKRRIIRAPAAGIITWTVELGDLVNEGQPLGYVGAQPILAPLSGKLRGLIAPGIEVDQGTKIGDVDPRGAAVDHLLISDKARNVGRGVLEAILRYLFGEL